MEVHKPRIPRYERNLLKRRFGPPPEPYHVSHVKTIYAEHYSKKDHGQCISEGSISMNLLIHDEKSFDKITESLGIRL